MERINMIVRHHTKEHEPVATSHTLRHIYSKPVKTTRVVSKASEWWSMLTVALVAEFVQGERK